MGRGGFVDRRVVRRGALGGAAGMAAGLAGAAGAFGAAPGIAQAGGGAPPAGAPAGAPYYSAIATLTDAPEIGDGIRLYGFSGLYAIDASGTRFWTVTDRGPNVTET